MDIKKYDEEIAFIKSSKYREIIFLDIDNDFKTPKEISKSKNIHLSEVSRALRGLKEKNLVEVMNPDANKSRFYRLSPKGQEILKYLKSIKKI